ncbi:MAG TPA: hypothetical protein VF209_02275 [Patescibacteria group bacterium]
MFDPSDTITPTHSLPTAATTAPPTIGAAIKQIQPHDREQPINELQYLHDFLAPIAQNFSTGTWTQAHYRLNNSEYRLSGNPNLQLKLEHRPDQTQQLAGDERVNLYPTDLVFFLDYIQQVVTAYISKNAHGKPKISEFHLYDYIYLNRDQKTYTEQYLLENLSLLKTKVDELYSILGILLDPETATSLEFNNPYEIIGQFAGNPLEYWPLWVEPLVDAFKAADLQATSVDVTIAATAYHFNIPAVRRILNAFIDNLKEYARDKKTPFDELKTETLDQVVAFRNFEGNAAELFFNDIEQKYGASDNDHLAQLEELVKALLQELSLEKTTEAAVATAEEGDESEGGETDTQEARALTLEEARNSLIQAALQQLITDIEFDAALTTLPEVDAAAVRNQLAQSLIDHYNFPTTADIEQTLKNFTFTDTATNSVQPLIDPETQQIELDKLTAHQETLFTQSFKAFFDQVPPGQAERAAFTSTLINQILEDLKAAPVAEEPEEQAAEEPAVEQTAPAAQPAQPLVDQAVVPTTELLTELRRRAQRDLDLDDWARGLPPDERLQLLDDERWRLTNALKDYFLSQQEIDLNNLPQYQGLLNDQIYFMVGQYLQQLSPEEQLQLLNHSRLLSHIRRIAESRDFQFTLHLFFEQAIYDQLNDKDEQRLVGNNLRRRSRSFLVLYGDKAGQVLDSMDQPGNEEAITSTLFGYQFAQQLRKEDRERQFIELAKQYLKHHKYQIESQGLAELSQLVVPLMPLEDGDLSQFSDPDFLNAHLRYISATNVDDEYFKGEEAFQRSQQLHQQLPEAAYKANAFQKPRGLLNRALNALSNRKNPVEKTIQDLRDLSSLGAGLATGNAFQAAMAAAALAWRNKKFAAMMAALAALVVAAIAWLISKILPYIKAALEALRLLSALQAGWSNLVGGISNAGSSLFGSFTSALTGSSEKTGVLKSTLGVKAGTTAANTGLGAAFNQVGIAAPTGAVALGVGMTLMSNAFLQSAFLMPEDFSYADTTSKYVQIEKEAFIPDPLNDGVQDVTYRITIQAKPGYKIRVTGVEDRIRIRYNDDPALRSNDGPSDPPPSNKDQAIATIIGQEIGEEPAPPIEYLVPYTQGDYNHASITNTFTLIFDVIEGDELSTGQTATATKRICFGDCPGFDCLEFGEAGFSFGPYGYDGTISLPWTPEYQNKVEEALELNLVDYTQVVDALCANGPITVYRLEASSTDAWGWAPDGTGGLFALYDIALQSQVVTLEYTVVHELGHIYDYRTGTVYRDRLSNERGSSGCYSYPLSCSLPEKFAEGFVMSIKKTMTLDGISHNFPEDYPADYQWYIDNILGEP